MTKEGYQYLAKCLAASVAAKLMDNTVEYEMRVNKDNAPDDLYYALASLLSHVIIRKNPVDIERLNYALDGHPK
jgi:hypothetical protein